MTQFQRAQLEDGVVRQVDRALAHVKSLDAKTCPTCAKTGDATPLEGDVCPYAVAASRLPEQRAALERVRAGRRRA